MANGGSRPTTSPLGDAELKRIKDSIGQLDEAQVQADLATRAGIDVSDQKKTITDTRQKLMRIKQVYFPNE